MKGCQNKVDPDSFLTQRNKDMPVIGRSVDILTENADTGNLIGAQLESSFARALTQIKCNQNEKCN